MSLNDGLPFLAVFMTYENRCATCGYLSSYSGWCFKHSKAVARDDTCTEYQKRVKKQ